MKRLKWLLIIPLMLTPGSPWIMKWIAQRQAKKGLGRPAPDTREVDGDKQFSLRLYYFHAPYCGPCKAMMPMIDKLQQQHPNLIKINVSEHETLAEAFGVSATPVFIVVIDNHVSEVKIGAQRESWLQNKLAGN
jgi:thioredoxin 1